MVHFFVLKKSKQPWKIWLCDLQFNIHKPQGITFNDYNKDKCNSLTNVFYGCYSNPMLGLVKYEWRLYVRIFISKCYYSELCIIWTISFRLLIILCVNVIAKGP